MASDIHVVPLNDWLEHVELRQCWCRPSVEDINGTALVTHHSADGREHSEPSEDED